MADGGQRAEGAPSVCLRFARRPLCCVRFGARARAGAAQEAALLRRLGRLGCPGRPGRAANGPSSRSPASGSRDGQYLSVAA